MGKLIRNAAVPSEREMTSQASDVQFLIREYRPADFDRLWEIDQLCFPSGIAYTQMELTGFISKRKAITLVAEAVNPNRAHGPGASASYPKIVGFVVAVPHARPDRTRGNARHYSRGTALWTGFAVDGGM